MTDLRPYQAHALDRLRSVVGSGCTRVMLAAPTGAGKTRIGCEIVHGGLSKGKRAAFCAPAISLIDQTVAAFERFGVDPSDIGVMQAGHWRTNGSRPVQVCSLQTLSSRGFPEVDIAIIDEAHELHRIVPKWMAARPGTVFIGLSATPWAKGLGKHYRELITVETTAGLIAAGYLSPFRIFSACEPDLSAVRTVAGEFHKGDLAAALDDGNLAGDVVANWIEHGESRPTICFAVDLGHARHLRARFEAAGVPVEMIEAATDIHDRDATARRLHAGETQVVVNVGTLTKGVDWDVRCLILARPTKSEMLHVQMIGRALRTAPGKQDALIFDHAGNCVRLGMPDAIRHDRLDDGKARKASGGGREKPAPKPAECVKCRFLRPAGQRICAACGHVHEHRREVEETGEALREIGATKAAADRETKQRWWSELRFICRDRQHSDGWAAHKYRAKFGVWPRGLSDAPRAPSPEVLNWVRAQNIRWSKSRKKQEEAA